MITTEAELAAARAFRESQRAALAAKGKPDITVSVLIHHYRHDCARQGGRSVGLELREHYVSSPAYVVEGTVATEAPDPDVGRGIARVTGSAFTEPGRFGFIYTEGRCAACGVTARSGDSRLVDTAVRPPGPRAVVSGITGHEDLRDRRSGQRDPTAQRQPDGSGWPEH